MRLRTILLILLIAGLFVLLFVVPNLYYPTAEVRIISEDSNHLPVASANADIAFQISLPYVLAHILQTFNISQPPLWLFQISGTLLGIITTLFGLFTSGCILLLYTRKKLSENPDSRHMKILSYLTDNPGAQQKDIIQATGYSRGSVSHHLRRLMQGVKICQIKSDAVRYYPIGNVTVELHQSMWRLLENEKRKRIFQTILHHPGISQKHIAEEIQIPVTTLRWHLEKMQKGNLILVDENQQRTSYSVNPSLHLLEYAQYL